MINNHFINFKQELIFFLNEIIFLQIHYSLRKITHFNNTKIFNAQMTINFLFLFNYYCFFVIPNFQALTFQLELLKNYCRIISNLILEYFIYFNFLLNYHHLKVRSKLKMGVFSLYFFKIIIIIKKKPLLQVGLPLFFVYIN